MKYALSFLLVLFFATSPPQASAQSDWEWNVDSGVGFYDDDVFAPSAVPEGVDEGMLEGDGEATFVAGTELRRYLGNVGLGAQFSWSPLSGVGPESGAFATPEEAGNLDANLFLYSAQASVTVPVSTVSLFAAAGVGGASTTFSNDDEVFLAEDPETEVVFENDTDLYVPLSLGVQTQLTDDLALTLTGRDNLIFANEADRLAADGTVLEEGDSSVENALQVTAGFSLTF